MANITNGMMGLLYQEVEIFGIPALFADWRLRDTDIPAGLYRYDLRGSDYDPGEPICVEQNVYVNHAGTIITATPLDLTEKGRLFFSEDEGINFTGGIIPMTQFAMEQNVKIP